MTMLFRYRQHIEQFQRDSPLVDMGMSPHVAPGLPQSPNREIESRLEPVAIPPEAGASGRRPRGCVLCGSIYYNMPWPK